MYIPHYFFLSVNEHLDCFYILTMVSNVAVNMRVQISIRVLLSNLWDIYLGVKLLGHVVVPYLTFFTVAAPFL